MTDTVDHEIAIERDVARGEDHTRRGRLAFTGGIATVVAMVATSLVTILAKAGGVDFELPDGGEAMPWSGVAVTTGVFSVVGILIAAGFRRWSARPAARFLTTTVTLTAISLLPPFLVEANAATVAALVVIHVVAAAVVIPALTRELRR